MIVEINNAETRKVAIKFKVKNNQILLKMTPLSEQEQTFGRCLIVLILWLSCLVSSQCSRHRKPWHLISDEERDLYINGMTALATQGKLKLFTQQHDIWDGNLGSQQAHGTSSFLTWHRYFIWELESNIRELGGQFECFSLPYWYDV